MKRLLQWLLSLKPVNKGVMPAAALLLVLAGLSVALANRVVSTAAAVDRGDAILAGLDSLRARVEQVATAGRRFVATGDESLLPSYRSAESGLKDALSDIGKLIADPGELAQLQQTDAQIAVLLKLGQEELTLRKQGDSGAERDRQTSERMMSTLDRLRGITRDMTARERQLQFDRRAQLDQQMRDLVAVLWAVTAGAVLLLFSTLRTDQGAKSTGAAPEGKTKAGAAPAAAAGRNASLDRELRNLLQAGTDYQSVFELVRRYAAGLFPKCSGVLYSADAKGDTLAAKTSWGTELGGAVVFEPAACWAIRRGETHFTAPASALACAHLEGSLEVPRLCVPITAQGSVFGLLLLADHSRTGALHALRPLAAEFADHLGMTFANLKLREMVRDLSMRDATTGLFNRRYVEALLPREVAIAHRKSRSMGVALISLDQFEPIGRERGRDAADHVIRTIAQLIVARVRSSDIVCRYSDDRLALVFPEAPLEGVLMRTNQLLQSVAALKLEYLGNTLGMLSASFGVAMFPQDGKTATELLHQANLALDSAISERSEIARGPSENDS